MSKILDISNDIAACLSLPNKIEELIKLTSSYGLEEDLTTSQRYDRATAQELLLIKNNKNFMSLKRLNDDDHRFDAIKGDIYHFDTDSFIDIKISIKYLGSITKECLKYTKTDFFCCLNLHNYNGKIEIIILSANYLQSNFNELFWQEKNYTSYLGSKSYNKLVSDNINVCRFEI